MYFTEPEPQIERAPDRMRARQGDRRLVLDQRHDLFARPPRRLRPLGRRTACRPGPTRTRCPISASRKPGRAAPSAHRGGDGPARRALVHLRGPAGRRLHRGEPGRRPEMERRPQQRPTTRASAATRTPSATAGAAAPRSPICGRRWSGDNLTVEIDALVTRIVIEGGRAVGVEYRQGGETHTCARQPRGAAGRRRDQLAAAADAVRHRRSRRAARGTASRPQVPLRGVGRNLQDHVTRAGAFERADPPGTVHHAMRLDRIAVALADTYLFGGTSVASDIPGGMASFAAVHAGCRPCRTSSCCSPARR